MRDQNLHLTYLFLGLCALLICLSIKQARGEFLTINNCSNCSLAESHLIRKAVIKTNETIASACFVSFMLKRNLTQTDGKNNEQVVQSLLNAGVVVDAEMYWTLKRVLGYTYPKKLKIWINRRYAQKFNSCDLASLLGHESSHKIGYGHSFNVTKDRPNSVPYSINAAFKQCCVR